MSTWTLVFSSFESITSAIGCVLAFIAVVRSCSKPILLVYYPKSFLVKLLTFESLLCIASIGSLIGFEAKKYIHRTPKATPAEIASTSSFIIFNCITFILVIVSIKLNYRHRSKPHGGFLILSYISVLCVGIVRLIFHYKSELDIDLVSALILIVIPTILICSSLYAQHVIDVFEPQKPLQTNPFSYNSPVKGLELVKIIISTILLIPVIRILCLIVVIFGAFLLSLIANTSFTKDKPSHLQALPSWKRKMMWACVFTFGRALLFILGVYWIHHEYPKENKAQKKNKRFNSSSSSDGIASTSTAEISRSRSLRGNDSAGSSDENEKPMIHVSNHVSVLDGIIFCICDGLSAVGKESIFQIPVAGPLLKSLQFIPVGRTSAESRQQVLDDIANRASLSPNDVPAFLIFPEGTTTNKESLIKFKKGAFTTRNPIQPCIIKYYTWLWDPSFVSEGETLFSLYRLLCQWFIFAKVEYLPVYYPTEEEMNDPDFYAENVRQVMAKALNVPTTNHSFDDYKLYQQSGRRRHSVQTNTIELDELYKLFAPQFEKQVVFRVLRKFDQLSKKGKVTLQIMKDELFGPNNKSSESLKDLFCLFDVFDTEFLSFREFCIGILLCNPELSTSLRLKAMFQFNDVENSGFITGVVIQKFLHVACKNLRSVGFEDVLKSLNIPNADRKFSLDQFEQYVLNYESLVVTVYEKTLTKLNESLLEIAQPPLFTFREKSLCSILEEGPPLHVNNSNNNNVQASSAATSNEITPLLSIV